MAPDNAFAVALLTLWHRVAEAGGAVGFALPVDRAQLGAAVAGVIDDLRSGRACAFALTRNRAVVGFALLEPGRQISAHTGVIKSVMVEPAGQRNGLGRILMESILTLATRIGLQRVSLTVRDGTGAEKFYTDLGFVETGRLPGWIRLGPHDERDQVTMFRSVGPDGGISAGR